MKIALIIPENGNREEKSFYDIKFATSFLFTKKYFSYLLAIPVLASLTPPEHEIRIFDENIEDIDYDWGADLVGISVRTMFAPRAYRISDNFRKRGITTVLGGIHPSVCPDEALGHSDAVLIGEAEDIWGQLLKDVETGNRKKIYHADKKADLATSPLCNRKNISQKKYFADIIQTTKGCPFTCEFCSVYFFDGQKIRNKPLQAVIDEISDIQSHDHIKFKKKSIFFADDNIISNKKYARKLFLRLKDLNMNWSCQASINISKEDELLRLMKASGCGSILVGLESISSKNLNQMDKQINIKHDYRTAIRKIQSYGILVHGSFILGSDFDETDSFDALIDFIDKTKLLMPLINILTPFPGTKLFERLEKEKRILHKNWDMYDARNVVFIPANLTQSQLKEGYRKVLQEVYSFNNIYKRLNYYWKKDFWSHSNKIDPVPFKFRFLFAIRLSTYYRLNNWERNKFILKIIPKLFDNRVRLSTILTLMSYNDFAQSL